ncbi:rhomboid family intramembrane serine protease [Acetivibrio saccincola]|jgi:membrane associated rhomboid family serine protease|uniref:Der1-like family protein n=1 Tax=Acetivibrio saccincola TaxID=1677857 RepID=A0A2K9EQ77_9FIRM|nr:hypothetical protein [Acetivibrio saccincola]AUG58781.1 Der1-like family protein [Acetivibrio saccincola]PQQ66125.1 hypothetical protein B9R14_04685 [Acetivibrio saccincola]HOA97246.1 hypothetical protein [Acetivibrio saccincola]HQD29065.1 hypothetical protein [Acetivibrio saccincola]
MGFLDRLERKIGKFAIKGLMMYIVALNMAVFLLDLFGGELFQESVILKLALIPEKVLAGEVWRLITFIFIPPPTTPLFIVFALILIYNFGTGLEEEWGSFKFNVYYFVGILETVIGSMITGYPHVVPHYLNLSLLFAFARLYPNYIINIFFVLPVPIKYIAWVDWAFMGISFLLGTGSTRIAVAAAVVNYFLFFGKDILFKSRVRGGSVVRKAKYQQYVKGKDYMHKCTVCGITEKDDPQMDFRYCSTCEGDYEYCMEHLKNHEHIKKS